MPTQLTPGARRAIAGEVFAVARIADVRLPVAIGAAKGFFTEQHGA